MVQAWQHRANFETSTYTFKQIKQKQTKYVSVLTHPTKILILNVKIHTTYKCRPKFRSLATMPVERAKPQDKKRNALTVFAELVDM